MSAETAAAITMTGASLGLIWLASQDYMRAKHEAVTLLFYFLGLLLMCVGVYTSSEFLRVQIDADLGSLWMTVLQVLLLTFVFVLFYFLLMIVVFWFKKFQRANDGIRGDD